MNGRTFIFAAFLTFLYPFNSGCICDAEWKLQRAIDRVREGDEGAHGDLASAFIASSSVDELDIPHLRSTGNVLYTMHGDRVTVQYPVTASFTLTDGGEIKHIDRSRDYTVITDGIQISIFDAGGGHRQDETLGEDKSRVVSLVIAGDRILYYRDQSLFIYSIPNRVSEKLLKETFPPPYTKYYSVHLTVKDDTLAVIAGIAGAYHGNLINIEDRTVMMRNIIMASSHCLLGSNTLFYIAGNAGNWELIRLTLDTKSKKTLKKFSDITDIRLAVGGYVLEKSTGLWASAYGSDATRIPFPYELAGIYKDRVILTHRGTSYIIDMPQFLASLAVVRQNIPALFEQKNEK